MLLCLSLRVCYSFIFCFHAVRIFFLMVRLFCCFLINFPCILCCSFLSPFAWGQDFAVCLCYSLCIFCLIHVFFFFFLSLFLVMLLFLAANHHYILDKHDFQLHATFPFCSISCALLSSFIIIANFSFRPELWAASPFVCRRYIRLHFFSFLCVLHSICFGFASIILFFFFNFSASLPDCRVLLLQYLTTICTQTRFWRMCLFLALFSLPLF